MLNPKRPNFLIIVADDLGYSDIGPFGGSDINTPALDRLSREGIRLTNFHTASACSPTRSMLFSGTDNHIAGLGQMEEQIRLNPATYAGKPGYEGYLNWRVAALSEILQDSGYYTVMSGKWHLGLDKALAPHARGFEKNFSFLPGAGNHFNFEPQLEEGIPALPFVWTDGFWMEGAELIDRKCDLPEDFYSSSSFTTKLIEYLQDRDPTSDQPFFAYLPFTAPHWPLQAHRETIEKYKGVYNNGPEELRKTRLKNLAQLGIISDDIEPAPLVGHIGEDWWDLSEEARQISARKMETYAAMVDEVDQNIQRVISYLESTGELDDTFILFMSDNGAEGKLLEAIPMMGGATNMKLIIERFYNNSLENIGNKDSFVWYGPRWACAATAPSRGFKTWITEGGIRCPCVVRYPPFTAEAMQNRITDSFTTVMDILPTILDLAGIALPDPSKPFRGRTIVPVRGKSWVKHLQSSDLRSTSVHGENDHIHGWELFGLQAIRKGPWKAILMPPPRGSNEWELYNVVQDPGEIHNRAGEHSDTLTALIRHWEEYYAETGMIDLNVGFGVVQG